MRLMPAAEWAYRVAVYKSSSWVMAAEVNASGRVQIHCSRVAEQLVGYGLDQCRRQGVHAL